MTKYLDPIRPSAAVRAAFEQRLDRELAAMHRSIVYWVSAAYRSNPPPIAMDASAADTLRRAIRKLGRRWLRKFDGLSQSLGTYYATAARDRVDGAMKGMLRDAGFTVRFRPTARMRDAYKAVVTDNATLIKGLAAKHLTDVEGDIMRSVMAGRDLGALADALQHTYGITQRRAAKISRHQNNMATAVFERERQLEAGLDEAEWLHSAGGKVPRPEHVAFSRNRYKIARGAFLEGKWTWPGIEIGCRCVSKAIIPGFD